MDCTVEQYSPELPEPIIHRIQSLLNLKKAAQTTLLSKPWRVAWSTHPALNLDEAEFPTHDNIWPNFPYPKIDEFPNFAKETFRMYKESNRSINTFRLRLEKHELYARSGLATTWTSKALKLGATDLTFEINHPDIAILLGAVCRKKRVASLRLQSSKIDQLKVFKLPGLKSLVLSDVKITWESFFNVISCCPLVENLSLSDILGRDQLYESDGDYDDDGRTYYGDGTYYDDDHDLTYDRVNKRRRKQQVARPRPPKFFLHKLRSLVLCRISSKFQIIPLFLNNLSSKFPNLKDLTLDLSFSNVAYFRKNGETQIISSRSLEVLNIRVGKGQDYYEKKEMPRFEFDVPSMREFTLDCTSYMPNLRFTPASMDRCESRVSLTQHGQLSIIWFGNLSRLFTELRGSKIHLCLHVDNRSSFHYLPGEFKCLMNECELENLTMNAKRFSSLSFNALLDGLFKICRPKMITQYISTYDYDDDNDDDDDVEEDEMSDVDDEMSVDHEAEDTMKNGIILCRELIQGMKSLNSSQHMYGLRDLVELSVQKLFDGEWRSQPLHSVLDDWSEKRRFRFQLKWKPL